MSRIKKAVTVLKYLLIITICRSFYKVVSYLLSLVHSSDPLPSFPAGPISSSRMASVELCLIPKRVGVKT